MFFPDLTPNHSPSTLLTGEWVPDTVPSFYAVSYTHLTLPTIYSV